MGSLAERDRSPVQLTLVGAGGVAQFFAPAALRLLNAFRPGSTAVVIDGDRGEARDVLRQSAEPGRNKARALVERHQGEFRNLELVAVERYAADDDVAAIVRDADVIAVLVDNDASRKLLVREFRAAGEGLLIVAGVDPVDPARGMSGHRATAHFHVRRSGRDLGNPFDVPDDLAAGLPSAEKIEAVVLKMLFDRPWRLVGYRAAHRVSG